MRTSRTPDGERGQWLLSAPALALVILGAAAPLLVIVVYSFLTPGPYGDVIWGFSLQGWRSVLLERDIFDGTLSVSWVHLSIFGRSILLAFVTTSLAFVLGFPTAYFIATRPPASRQLWLFGITIPFWTNLLIRTFAIQELIRNEGVVNLLLLDLGIVSSPVRMMYTDFALLLGMTYVFLPLMVLPVYASLERLDFRIMEAAYDLYATPFLVMRRIVLPAVMPGIVAGAILVFIPALGAYVTPRLLGGGTNLMIGSLIELQFGQGRNWPLGGALALALLAFVLVALLAYVRVAFKPSGVR